MKNILINFRVTQEQRENYHRLASKEGSSLAEYLRDSSSFREFCKMYFKESNDPQEFYDKCEMLFKFTNRTK